MPNRKTGKSGYCFRRLPGVPIFAAYMWCGLLLRQHAFDFMWPRPDKEGIRKPKPAIGHTHMLPHGHYLSEHHFLVFLIQILLLLVMARGLGEVLRHWGHPPVVGEILVGLLLGPTLLGRFSPELYQTLFPPDPIQFTMLETVSWFGVLLLLLETGLEIDVSTAWQQRGPALRIGIIGVIVPMAVGVSPIALSARHLSCHPRPADHLRPVFRHDYGH